MKKLLLLTLITLSASIVFTGCHINDYDDEDRYYYDDNPPAAPKGLYILNGDNTVQISWDWNNEDDVEGYNVYYSDTYNGKYKRIGWTDQNYFNDNEAVNGVRSYYAVTAFDFNKNESELSYEEIYATPRPQGSRQSVYNYVKFPEQGAFSFTTYTTVDVESNNADFMFEVFEGQNYLFVREDTDIQDMGPTNDIYDVEFAPQNGWSPTKDAIAIPGHTYVIWTFDDHYAKVRLRSINGDQLVFDWAFQLVEKERQLKPRNKPSNRPPVTKEWLNSRRAAL